MIFRTFPSGWTVRPIDSKDDRKIRYASDAVTVSGAITVTFDCRTFCGTMMGRHEIDLMKLTKSASSASGFRLKFTFLFGGNALHSINSAAPGRGKSSVGFFAVAAAVVVVVVVVVGPAGGAAASEMPQNPQHHASSEPDSKTLEKRKNVFIGFHRI
jgi:hypothetical protein